MRQEIGAVLTLETVAVIGGVASISAGAHAVGTGFVADVVMVGGAVVCSGAGQGVFVVLEDCNCRS